jgi:hypothetical protein
MYATNNEKNTDKLKEIKWKLLHGTLRRIFLGKLNESDCNQLELATLKSYSSGDIYCLFPFFQNTEWVQNY